MSLETKTTVFTIVAIVFVLFAAITIFLPNFQKAVAGGCWADAVNELNKLYTTFNQMKSANAEEFSISLGSCIDVLAIGELGPVAKETSDTYCDIGYESAMVLVPDVKKFTWIKRLDKDNTDCKQVPCSEERCRVSTPDGTNVIVLRGPKKEEIEHYCITIHKEALDSFKIDYYEGECDGRFEGFE